MKLAKTIYGDNDKVDIVGFPRQLTVDVAKEHNACAIIRGLRAVSDFEYEFQLAGMNRKLYNKIETIFLMSKPEFSFIHSSLVKQISLMGGDVTGFVSDSIKNQLKTKS